MRHTYMAKESANNSSGEADGQHSQKDDGTARDMREEIERENGGQHDNNMLLPVDDKKESRVARSRVKSSRQSSGRKDVKVKARAKGKESSRHQPAKKRATPGSSPTKTTSSRKKAASSLANIVTPDAVKTKRRLQDGDAAKRKSSEKNSAKSAKGPPPQDGLTTQRKVLRDYRIFLKQKRALSALMAATDLISIRASLGLVKELFGGYDEVPPEVYQLANDAEITSQYLMFQTLRASLTSPVSFGGLGFSDFKASLLINQLFEAMGPRLNIEVDVSIEKMQLVGALVPLVRTIGEGIRKKEMALKKEINDLVLLEMTCWNPLPHAVMSGDTQQRIVHEHTIYS
jgi:hypothetical protein